MAINAAEISKIRTQLSIFANEIGSHSTDLDLDVFLKHKFFPFLEHHRILYIEFRLRANTFDEMKVNPEYLKLNQFIQKKIKTILQNKDLVWDELTKENELSLLSSITERLECYEKLSRMLGRFLEKKWIIPASQVKNTHAVILAIERLKMLSIKALREKAEFFCELEQYRKDPASIKDRPSLKISAIVVLKELEIYISNYSLQKKSDRIRYDKHTKEFLFPNNNYPLPRKGASYAKVCDAYFSICQKFANSVPWRELFKEMYPQTPIGDPIKEERRLRDSVRALERAMNAAYGLDPILVFKNHEITLRSP